ncbi:MAG TPA: hypothetical protein VJT67_04480 [Longimicrobiaceae bacterium]|nr:hypothetical protein [Longimicrobiaceae bacterium]
MHPDTERTPRIVPDPARMRDVARIPRAQEGIAMVRDRKPLSPDPRRGQDAAPGRR